MPTFDVLICGAGAGGLTLAYLLGRRGHRVLLVDKQSSPRSVHKGELLQPRSVQLLDSVGLIEPLSRQGARTVRSLSCHTAKGVKLNDLDFALLDGQFNYGLLHFYKDFRATIGDQLAQGEGVEYWQGTSVTGVLRDVDGRIIGARLASGRHTFDVDAALTVVCDGQRSRLRTAAGIDVSLRRYDHQLVGFELLDVGELGEDMAMYLSAEGLRVLFQMPGGRARLYVQIPVNGFREIGRANVGAWVDGLLREVPALSRVAEPLRACANNVQVLSASRFIAPDWSVPGLVLLGDAAHGVHPMVGQGMNAAIADAWSLAEHLSMPDSLSTTDVDVVAERYVAARRPVMDYVARLSHILAVLFTTTSKGARLVRPGLLRSNRDNALLRRRIVYNMAGFGSEPFTGWALRSALGLTRRT